MDSKPSTKQIGIRLYFKTINVRLPQIDNKLAVKALRLAFEATVETSAPYIGLSKFRLSKFITTVPLRPVFLFFLPTACANRKYLDGKMYRDRSHQPFLAQLRKAASHLVLSNQL